MKNIAKLVFGFVPMSIAVTAAAIFFVSSSANAHKDPVTAEQLKSYDAAFLEEVKKGDLLFHGDAATAKAMDVNLSSTGMACAMCHPYASDTHPQTYPKFQAQVGKFSTLRDMINWCIEKPMQGEKIDPESEAMKDLEAYIAWSNTGSVMTPGKY